MADKAAPAVSQLAGEIIKQVIAWHTDEGPIDIAEFISAALSEREELIRRLLVHWDRNEIDFHYACSEAVTDDLAAIFRALAAGS